MKTVQLLTGLLCFCMTLATYGQTENTSTVVDWRQHNLNKYNRMLVNPAYSIAREDVRAISFWSRIQWTGVSNSPQTFLLNYSGKIGPSSGAGLGLYQQNLGLLTDSGILMNYAYEVQLGERVALALGINSTLFRRGLNKNAVTSAAPDPTVLENQDDFLWLFMPGLNLRIGGFDLGVYAENLFDYNLSESRTVTGFDSKIYSGQLGYTHTFKNAYGVFNGATWRNLTYVKTLPNNETQYGGSSMIDLSRFGWMQMGYNNVYGVNAALGVKLGDGMSVGVIYERGSNLSGVNFGPTYEAIATIELGRGKTHTRVVYVHPEEEDALADDEVESVVAEEEVFPEPEASPGARVVRSGKYTVYGGTATDDRAPVLNSAEEDLPEEGITAREDQVVAGIVADIKAEEVSVPDTAHEQIDWSPEDRDEEKGVRPVAIEVSPEIAGSPAEALVADSAEEGDPSQDIASTPKNDQPVVTREVLGRAEGYKTMEVRQGIDKGFYLVVNVFSRERNFKDFKDALEDRGFEPRYFVNPDNNYWYVYLAHADNYYRVKQLQRSHLGGTYRDDKWVLWIK